jgi:hypothetical protein
VELYRDCLGDVLAPSLQVFVKAILLEKGGSMTNLKCMLSFLAISCLLADPSFCDKKAGKVVGDAKKGSSPTAQLLWSQPRDMAWLDLFHGPGRRAI